MDRLVAALRDRETLLILDNCEHVIEAAAAFAHRLLGECRRLRIVATSREPLGITGEALWQVAPLALPEDDADPATIEADPISTPMPPPWPRWRGCAARSTGFRWRSNWPPPGYAP
ncbi:regulatory protein LuxR [Mycobacteroides abscessus subsp. abscessus]|nr:regulatory protein LuxR [Mycobacteroides abscessus subsp. abscessus]